MVDPSQATAAVTLTATNQPGTTSSAPTTISPLLDLPKELRLVIYESALEHEQEAVIGTKGECKLPALLETCQLVRFDALPIWYGETNFRARMTWSDMKDPLLWLRSVPKNQVPRIRRLTVSFNAYQADPAKVLDANRYNEEGPRTLAYCREAAARCARTLELLIAAGMKPEALVLKTYPPITNGWIRAAQQERLARQVRQYTRGIFHASNPAAAKIVGFRGDKDTDDLNAAW